jgi:hypothetical protein
VGGYAANGLVRVASKTGSVSITGGGDFVAATVSITAPAAGFVLVNGTTTEEGGTCPCEVGNYVEDTVASTRSTWNEYGTIDGSGNYASSTTSYVFPVSAGVRTFELRAFRFSGSGTNTVYGELTAMYVPFGSTGGSTLAPHVGASQTHVPSQP